jgi:hypothetical protein
MRVSTAEKHFSDRTHGVLECYLTLWAVDGYVFPRESSVANKAGNKLTKDSLRFVGNWLLADGSAELSRHFGVELTTQSTNIFFNDKSEDDYSGGAKYYNCFEWVETWKYLFENPCQQTRGKNPIVKRYNTHSIWGHVLDIEESVPLLDPNVDTENISFQPSSGLARYLLIRKGEKEQLGLSEVRVGNALLRLQDNSFMPE